MEKMAKNAEKCYFGKCKDSLERVVIKRKQTREKVCGLCLNANSCILY